MQRLNQIQKEYAEVNLKLERLLDLMVSGVVTPDEGALKKQSLLSEKARIFNLLSKFDTHATEWTNLTIDTFLFVKSAREKFKNGSLETRKTILRVIGSHLVLKDKKLSIELRKPFEYIQKVSATLSSGKARIVPNKLPVISSRNVFLGARDPVLGGVPDLNRQPSEPQSDALAN